MIVGSLLACIGFASYSFLRLMANQEKQRKEEHVVLIDTETGSDAKQRLLDYPPVGGINPINSFPSKH